jgi:hypothetical protein
MGVRVPPWAPSIIPKLLIINVLGNTKRDVKITDYRFDYKSCTPSLVIRKPGIHPHFTTAVKHPRLSLLLVG